MTSGGVSGGGGWLFGLGMSSLTAWVMTGSEMISVTSSTSITSMSGVVLMSHIGCARSSFRTLIAMNRAPRGISAVAADAVVRLGEEADLLTTPPRWIMYMTRPIAS